MSVGIVADLSWGDCGKGKCIDLLAARSADVIARSGGGANAGHTLKVGKQKVILRLVPSGILHSRVKCLLGSGMVIDLDQLFAEIDELNQAGIKTDNLFISSRAHLIFDWHKKADELSDKSTKIGTTKRGIGPCYQDKFARLGVRVCDLKDPGHLKERMLNSFYHWRSQFSITNNLGDPENIYKKTLAQANRLQSMVVNTAEVLHQELQTKKNIWVETAQGLMLDIDFGSDYPYCTSSNPSAGGACTGLGLAPTDIDYCLGLTKSYTTRVGAGLFPTEQDNKIGERLREVGQEYGSNTGRPRRCGWLCLPSLKYACQINGVGGLAIMKLDVLSAFEKIQACTGYQTPTGFTDKFPADELKFATPIYQEFEGWGTDISKARRLEDLPKAARTYLDFIQEYVGREIVLISVGPDRKETIFLKEPF